MDSREVYELKSIVMIFAASIRVTTRVVAMNARNMEHMARYQTVKYGEQDFLNVIKEEGIEYNDVQSILFHR